MMDIDLDTAQVVVSSVLHSSTKQDNASHAFAVKSYKQN